MKNDLQILGKYSSAAEAEIVKSILSEHDIEAFVHDNHITRVYGMGAPIFGGVKVRVHASDVTAAQELLRKVQMAAVEEGEIIGIECPKCKSTQTEYEYKKQYSLGIFALLFSIIPHYRMTEHWKCHSCKNEWTLRKGGLLDKLVSILMLMFFVLVIGMTIARYVEV